MVPNGTVLENSTNQLSLQEVHSAVPEINRLEQSIVKDPLIIQTLDIIDIVSSYLVDKKTSVDAIANLSSDDINQILKRNQVKSSEDKNSITGSKLVNRVGRTALEEMSARQREIHRWLQEENSEGFRKNTVYDVASSINSEFKASINGEMKMYEIANGIAIECDNLEDLIQLGGIEFEKVVQMQNSDGSFRNDVQKIIDYKEVAKELANQGTKELGLSLTKIPEEIQLSQKANIVLVYNPTKNTVRGSEIVAEILQHELQEQIGIRIKDIKDPITSRNHRYYTDNTRLEGDTEFVHPQKRSIEGILQLIHKLGSGSESEISQLDPNFNEDLFNEQMNDIAANLLANGLRVRSIAQLNIAPSLLEDPRTQHTLKILEACLQAEDNAFYAASHPMDYAELGKLNQAGALYPTRFIQALLNPNGILTNEQLQERINAIHLPDVRSAVTSKLHARFIWRGSGVIAYEDAASGRAENIKLRGTDLDGRRDPNVYSFKRSPANGKFVQLGSGGFAQVWDGQYEAGGRVNACIIKEILANGGGGVTEIPSQFSSEHFVEFIHEVTQSTPEIKTHHDLIIALRRFGTDIEDVNGSRIVDNLITDIQAFVASLPTNSPNILGRISAYLDGSPISGVDINGQPLSQRWIERSATRVFNGKREKRQNVDQQDIEGYTYLLNTLKSEEIRYKRINALLTANPKLQGRIPRLLSTVSDTDPKRRALDSLWKGRYLIQEKIPGQTLESLVNPEKNKIVKMPEKEAGELILGLLEVIAEYQKPPCSLIHLDIKPENIMLVPASNGLPAYLALIDWGNSKDRGHKLTAEEKIGSPGYAAPEQYRRMKYAYNISDPHVNDLPRDPSNRDYVIMPSETGPETDLYAIMRVYYTLVTGKTINERDRTIVDPEVSNGLRAIIEKATSRQFPPFNSLQPPYHTVQELRLVLMNYLRPPTLAPSLEDMQLQNEPNIYGVLVDALKTGVGTYEEIKKNLETLSRWATSNAKVRPLVINHYIALLEQVSDMHPAVNRNASENKPNPVNATIAANVPHLLAALINVESRGKDMDTEVKKITDITISAARTIPGKRVIRRMYSEVQLLLRDIYRGSVTQPTRIQARNDLDRLNNNHDIRMAIAATAPQPVAPSNPPIVPPVVPRQPQGGIPAQPRQAASPPRPVPHPVPPTGRAQPGQNLGNLNAQPLGVRVNTIASLPAIEYQRQLNQMLTQVDTDFTAGRGTYNPTILNDLDRRIQTSTGVEQGRMIAARTAILNRYAKYANRLSAAERDDLRKRL